MAINKQKKEEILKGLKDNLKDAKVVVFVNFHGLNVKAAGELRKLLREIKAKYFVAKKTLIKKALENFKFDGSAPEMEGEISVAISENDPLAPARIIAQFAKKNKVLKFAGGVFENKYVGPEMIAMLANIPSREILLGQIVNIINSPIQGLVVALNERVKKLKI